MERAWKTKEGFIPISELDDNYLQKALFSAEIRFVENYHLLLKQSHKAEIFETKMKELREEAKARGLNYKSLADTPNDKFKVIRNTYYLADKTAES